MLYAAVDADEQNSVTPTVPLEQVPVPRSSPKTAKSKKNGGQPDLKATLWAAADKMRGNMDPSEYKHVVLGLIFLKYISDRFEAHRETLRAKVADPASDYYSEDPADLESVLEDRDEYTGDNVFWVPRSARWGVIQSGAKLPTVGQALDEAMIAIEKENASLKGVLPKAYGSSALDKQLLGELIDLIGTIGFRGREDVFDEDGEKLQGHRPGDVLGQVYEYFLGLFANAEGKRGGEFYTATCIVKLLVEMLEPYKGRVFDPCCGSGGMFVQSEAFVDAHGGKLNDISVFGQESNPTTWKLARMNLAIRGIEANLGARHANSFHDDLHKDLKADFVLANPPFNDSDWGGERLRDDPRWKYGVPPTGNANFAWVQHFVHHLAPTGTAGFVLANGSMSSQQSGEGDIRKAIVEDDLVDCMVSLPGQLFQNVQIPVCLWFLTRRKNGSGRRIRAGETLFIDARKLGVMRDRTHKDLAAEDIARIAGVYHAWRGEADAGPYEDIAGFCRAVATKEIAEHNYILTPGRYVGAEEVEDDDEPFEEKMTRLVAELETQFAEAGRLEGIIRLNLQRLGYGPE
jgi:type I restriction enzyme M protein